MIYGANPGDTIKAATFDGAYAGAIAVDEATNYQLTLSQVGGSGLSTQDDGSVPYLSLTPQSDGDGLYLKVAGLGQRGFIMSQRIYNLKPYPIWALKMAQQQLFHLVKQNQWPLSCLSIFLILLVGLGLWPAPVYADDPTFDDTNTFGVASSTNTVAVGDFNNDGTLDLAVGNLGQNHIYLNDGTSNFYTGQVDDCDNPPDNVRCFGHPDRTTGSMAVGDINNDGALDLIVGNGVFVAEQNRVYLNDGTGNFSAGTPLGNLDITWSVAVGDLNNDGSLDLVFGNVNQPNQIYLNDGMGNFSTGTPFGDSDTTYSVAVGDFNNDSFLDLVVGNFGQQNLVYLNDGAGNFSAATPISASDNTNTVAVGDINGDGALDIIVGNENFPFGEQNLIYLNDGLGNFPSATPFGDPNTTTSVALGELNGDGALDLVVGNMDLGASQQGVVYLNDGTGNFSSTISFGNSDSIRAVAMADLNGDGALDLVTGIFGGQNLVYLNGGASNFTPATALSNSDDTRSVAVGDFNDDDALDFVVGNQNQNYVYLNDTMGAFSAIPFGNSDDTYSVASGDLNGDDALDIVVGNHGQNYIYFNDGTDSFSSAVSFGSPDTTSSIVLGDLNGDGPLDIIVGNGDLLIGQQNRVYLNDGTGNFSSGDPFGVEDPTQSLAVGDLDGDGDLDIVAGNFGQEDRVYFNDGMGNFSSPNILLGDADPTQSVAIGDLDGDGYLDVIVGRSGEENRVYLNEGGGTFAPPISFGSPDTTQSVVVGDVNGDGALDLVVGNFGEQNRIYLNDGAGNFFLETPFGDLNPTMDVAMGDLNGDGSLDLVVGNGDPLGSSGEQNQIHLNGTRLAVSLVDNVSYAAVIRPITTANADFYSSPLVVARSTIPITYTLFDPEENSVRFARVFYSPNGGGEWFPATPVGETITTSLAASSDGTSHTFTWDAEADLIKSDNVVFQIEAYQGFDGPGPYQWPYASAQTFPFRVEAAEWYAKVVSGTSPVEGAEVYLDGQLITTTVNNSYLTDRAGLLRLDNPIPSQPLVTLWQTKEQATTRATHDGWAYRAYITSLNLDNEGVPHPDTIGAPGQQLVTIRPDNPLTLFNIVVSVEWDATDDYLAMLEDAFRKASDYLYDVTDGQMAFGQVNIYDNAEYWSDADFQISTKNTVRPYAFPGGITSSDEAHTIRVGRFWDGGSGNTGNWNEPAGYRTLIHEFGHYALHLYDEYFIHILDSNGNFIREEAAACTSVSVKENSSDATNGSLMYWQYNASELVGNDRWNEDCQNTEQHRRNSKSDWQTALEHYGGSGWTINTPTSRGNVMAGPSGFPDHLLPFPEITVHNSGVIEGTSRQLTVLNPEGQGAHNALVALYTTLEGNTIAIDQGLTDHQGKISLYGANPGDTIKAATFDGAYAGAIAVGEATNYQLTLSQVGGSGLSAQDDGSVPYLSLTPQSDGDGLYLKVAGLGQGSLPLDAFVAPAEGGGSPQSTSLAYSPAEEAYVGTVSLSGVGLGTGRVRVSGDSLPSAINSDYNLQRVQAITNNALYSEDGNFELHIPPNGVPADVYATVLPTGYVPGPLLAGRQVIGSAYEVRLSGALTELDKDGLVRLHYHPRVMGVYTDTLIYHWNAGGQVWQSIGGEPNEIDKAWAVSVSRPGIYALMGAQVAVMNDVYLPLILKQ